MSGIPLNLIEDEQNQDLSKKIGFLNPDVEVLESQPLVQYDGDPLDVDGSPLDNEDDRSPSPVRYATKDCYAFYYPFLSQFWSTIFTINCVYRLETYELLN